MADQVVALAVDPCQELEVPLKVEVDLVALVEPFLDEHLVIASYRERVDEMNHEELEYAWDPCALDALVADPAFDTCPGDQEAFHRDPQVHHTHLVEEAFGRPLQHHVLLYLFHEAL